MAKKIKNKFFAKHKKSSALVMSIIIHGLLLAGALSFVTVTVVLKDEVGFEAKPIKRPRMNLRKLQVPVKMPEQRPKLRKTIVVKPNLKRVTPDIKMPELLGVKGGVGNGTGTGLGGAASLGFSMPELNMFGVKGKGEKVFIILDSSPEMMYDKIGGIPAYTIIKQELINTLRTLTPMALFNVAVYDGSSTEVRFPEMVPATESNVTKAEQWLKPLNAVKPEMGDEDWGLSSIGMGGQVYVGKKSSDRLIQKEREWFAPTSLAMQQKADVIFLLTCKWGNMWHIKESRDNTEWYNSSAGKRWTQSYEKAKKMLAAENRKRAAAGRPPMVVDAKSARKMNRMFFPGLEQPPLSEKQRYSPRDLAEGLVAISRENKATKMPRKSGIQRKSRGSKLDFSFNVIHFQPSGGEGKKDENFNQIVEMCAGEYRIIEGLEAIQRSATE